jgi:hypothetical protein
VPGQRQAAAQETTVGDQTVRSTIRRYALPTTLCLVGALAVACDDTCPPITEPPRAPLGARYVLDRVDGQPLPFVTQQGDARRVRVLADTLRFTPAGVQDEGTFTQTTILGTQEGTQPEVVSRETSAPGARRYTRAGPFDVVLTLFMDASSVGASVSPGADAGSSVLFVMHGGRTWHYVIR